MSGELCSRAERRLWRRIGPAWLAAWVGMAPELPADDRGKSRPATVDSRMFEVTDVHIPMRDGESLMGDIWLPQQSGRFPAILMMTPYNRKILGAALPDPAYKQPILDPQNYAYVYVDWRGYFGSSSARKGQLALAAAGKTLLDQLGEDGHDTVEWIAQQPWSNGKVGMWGPSALGRVQFFTAATRPPHLVCAVPVVCEYGYDYEVYYFGGVLKKGYVDLLGSAGYGGAKMALEHPTKDAWWAGLKRLTHPERIEIPMLMIGGWYDLYPEGIIHTFNELGQVGGAAARDHSKLLMGPWHHVAVGELEQGDLQFPEAAGVSVREAKRFFDYWLRDQKNNGFDREPRVRYFQMGVNQWRDGDQFPPQIAKTEWYLQPGGGLATAPPSAGNDHVSFVFDPKDPSPTVGGMNAFLPSKPERRTVGAGPRDQGPVLTRKDAVVFRSEVLRQEVEVTGRASLTLFVSSDRPDTDFAVRLCDVHPDGRTLLVSDGIQRLSLRNSLTKEEPAQPGKIYRITLELSTTAHTFLAGHRVAIILTSSNYPRFDTNDNGAAPGLFRRRVQVATNTVYHSKERPSLLTLPAQAAKTKRQ